MDMQQFLYEIPLITVCILWSNRNYLEIDVFAFLVNWRQDNNTVLMIKFETFLVVWTKNITFFDNLNKVWDLEKKMFYGRGVNHLQSNVPWLYDL